jgi:hypothetical protein
MTSPEPGAQNSGLGTGMIILRWLGWGCLAIGVLTALLIVDEQQFALLPSAVSLAVAGVLFLGFDRVIVLLTDIRGALVPEPVTMADDAGQQVDHPLGWKPRTPEELKMAIDRLKSTK